MTAYLYAPAQDVGARLGLWNKPERRNGALHRRTVQNPASELRRISLPRNPVNNLFGECAGLGSLASSLLAGKGYGKDVL